jgi:hypothetical protein
VTTALPETIIFGYHSRFNFIASAFVECLFLMGNRSRKSLAEVGRKP